MSTNFLHGVEVLTVDTGTRPITTVRSSVIGLVGTAPDADADAYPYDTPVLIAGSRIEAAKLGVSGSLPQAMDGIFNQAGAVVVVVRVPDDDDEAIVKSAIIGGVDADTGKYKGIHGLLSSESQVHVRPRLIIAPKFSSDGAVAAELLVVAEKLRAMAIIDGTNTNDDSVKTFVGTMSSARAFVVDPWVKVWDTATSEEVVSPVSSHIAGLIAKTDNDRGFWWSPSNKVISGITGTCRPIDFALGEQTSRANLLNEMNVATIINEDGYRLWGNRTLSSDARYTFINVQRTADIIADSVKTSHLWAIDRNINSTYFRDVVEGVNNYIRELKSIGAVVDGNCWADPEMNTPDVIEKGHAYFDFDFTPNYPAERVTFRQHMINDYLEQIFA